MSEPTLIRENPFALKTRDNADVSLRDPSTMDAVISRQAQEVHAAMVIAKKYPRDELKAWDRIMRSCQRPALAEDATYSYPKGDTNVSGPSIRLAECLAQNWGNLDFGIIELHQADGKSEMMAYAWDLETNTRQTKIFTVNHSIQKKGGQMKILTDPRDIYEITANQGARRVRACILGIIPGDIVEDAVRKCDETLSKVDGDVPIVDRVKKMMTVFDGVGVTPSMIEKRFKKKLDKLGEQELVILRKIYTSIRDGFSKVSDQFEPAAETATDLRQQVEQPKKEPEVAKVQPASSNSQAVEPTPATQTAAAEKQPKATRAKKEPTPAEEPSDLETVNALLTTASLSETEVIEVCIRKFQAVHVKAISEWDAGYLKDVIQYWTLINDQIRLDRALK